MVHLMNLPQSLMMVNILVNHKNLLIHVLLIDLAVSHCYHLEMSSNLYCLVSIHLLMLYDHLLYILDNLSFLQMNEIAFVQ